MAARTKLVRNSDTPMTKRISKLAAAVALVGVGAGQPAGADEQGAVVIYGGMGHLAKRAQPMFGAILEGNVGPGMELRRTIESRIQETARSTKLPWSPYPIVVDREDAVGVAKHCARMRGAAWTSDYPAMDDLRDLCGRILVLSVVADLEMHVPRPPLYDGDDYLENFFTGVTAVLTDPEDKSIVLSASAFGEASPGPTAHGFVSPARRAEIFADRYARTAVEAIALLQSQMQRTRPSDAFDRHMVAGIIVSDAKAFGSFELAPWRGAGGRSVCRLPDQCAGGEVCSKLYGLAASALTAALSRAGRLTMPPATWTYWTRRTKDLISLRLALARGAYWQEEELQIAGQPSEAEVKLIVQIARLSRTDLASKAGNYLAHRVHVAGLKLIPYRTDMDDCRKVLSVEDAVIGQASITVPFVPKYADQSPSLLRALDHVTLINASKEVEKNVH